MCIGFQTEQGSLYWIDPQGFTHRFRHRDGGHQPDMVHPPHSCIFVPEAVRDDALGLNTIQYRVFMAVLEGGFIRDAGSPAALRDAVRRGDRVCLAVMERLSGIIVGGGPGRATPDTGLYPFEQARLRDAGGVARRHTHLGHRITALFRTPGELIARGYPVAHILKHGGLRPPDGTRGAQP